MNAFGVMSFGRPINFLSLGLSLKKEGDTAMSIIKIIALTTLELTPTSLFFPNLKAQSYYKLS